VEFYGRALILLAALMKVYGCGGMKDVERRGTANEERFEQTAFLRHCMKYKIAVVRNMCRMCGFTLKHTYI
jgi:hypothetical protein